MRRASLLTVITVVLAVHPVFAQNTTARQASSHAVQAVKHAVVAVPGGLQQHLAAVDTLRNFDPLADSFTWFWNINAPDSGYVHGTNWFEDQAKATALALPDGLTEVVVTEVIVWFSFRRDGLTNQTYAIEILEGTPDAGPGNVLGRQEFMQVDINADQDTGTVEPTRHVFDEPVRVGSSFFVSVDFGSYGEADWGNAAIVATDLQGEPIQEDWEKFSDGTWHLMTNEWFQNADDGWHVWIEAVIDTDLTVATQDSDDLPHAFTLVQNFPNPFTASTTLQIEVPTRSEVALHVVDLLGRTVATLVEGTMEAGVHRVRFDGEDLPPGIYLARLQTGTAVFTRKMVLVH